MTAKPPKIWNTTFARKTINYQPIDYDTQGVKFDYFDTYRRLLPVAPARRPDRLFFSVFTRTEKQKNALPDIFKITDGLIVISERFRDLLQGFDLGPTQLFEVPLYDYNKTDRRPGRWFILHIVASKTAFVPERSENVEKIAPGHWRPARIGEDRLAVSASVAAVGEDLWCDRLFDTSRAIFLSDRLKEAIKTAGIRARSMPFRPCIVVE